MSAPNLVRSSRPANTMRALALLCASTLLVAPTPLSPFAARAQAPANASTSQAGTVKSVSGSTVVVTTDAKVDVTVTPAGGARILQLAPGSKDLKSAQPIQLTDITVGDRVLVTGQPGASPSSLTAARIILMKATAIADLHANQSADWQRRGSGGIVKSVDGADLTIAAGARTVTVVTTPSTIYRRYAGDSVKFEDAKPGTVADIHPGDQLRVRGDRRADGATITAEEIVSGSFENLAGVISSVDATAGTVTLKDLTTKKTVTVAVTANSNLRHLPPEAAAAYARRQSGAQGASATPASASASVTPPSGNPAPSTSGTGDRPRGAGGGRGGDLAQLIQRLPTETLAQLKPGQAVLIVASQTATGATAITMLSGVEPILSASPGGTAPQLSPWNLGGGAGAEGEAGAGGGGGGGGAPGVR